VSVVVSFFDKFVDKVQYGRKLKILSYSACFLDASLLFVDFWPIGFQLFLSH